VNDHQVAVLFLDLALIVGVAWLVGRLARAVGQPAVIGEIIGGIIVGPSLFRGAIADVLLPSDIRPFLGAAANLGLVLFMFVVGFELDLGRLRDSGRVTGAAALGSTVLPFALGLLLAAYLLHDHPTKSRVGFVLYIGIAVSVTAFPVLARVIADRRMGGTRLGTVALSSAVVCDVAAWSMLAVVQAVVGRSGPHGWLVLLAVPSVVVLAACVRPLLTRLFARGGPDGAVSATNLAAVLVGLLASAAVTQAIGLHFVFGAFLFGLVMPRMVGTVLRGRILEQAGFAIALLLPAFFILSGLSVNLSTIGVSGLLELALVLVVAITGKFAGTWVGARSQGFSPRDSTVLATLMNTRGLTELVALSLGLQIGVLDTSLYSQLVVMTLVTTAMAGPILRLVLSRERPTDDEPPPDRVPVRAGRGPFGRCRMTGRPAVAVIAAPRIQLEFMSTDERNRFTAAGTLALHCYPGAIGEIVRHEILFWEGLSRRLDLSRLMTRVVDQLATEAAAPRLLPVISAPLSERSVLRETRNPAQLMAAVDYARDNLGAIGELLAGEIAAYVDHGHRFPG
jgi:Kef-type K+ transport system membrane component KefB